MNQILHMIFSDGTPKKAFLTALFVGTILTVVNHGGMIVQGEMPPSYKIILTYVIPYCVTTWGAITVKLAYLKKQGSDK